MRQLRQRTSYFKHSSFSMIVFLDTEFASLDKPELRSLGLVTLDGREHYVELDLETDTGRARRRASSDFVIYGVLDF